MLQSATKTGNVSCKLQQMLLFATRVNVYKRYPAGKPSLSSQVKIAFLRNMLQNDRQMREVDSPEQART
jgi:lipopolysaccharide export system protein LptA